MHRYTKSPYPNPSSPGEPPATASFTMIHATFLHPPAWHGATPAVRPGTLLAARAAGTKTRASPRRNRLQHFGALLLWAPALLWSGAQAAAFDQAQIQRPRASFIDVGARMTFLRSGAQDAHLSASLPRASNCRGTDAVLPLPGPMSIPPRYQVGNHGRLHPDYDKAVAALPPLRRHRRPLGQCLRRQRRCGLRGLPRRAPAPLGASRRIDGLPGLVHAGRVEPGLVPGGVVGRRRGAWPCRR